MNLIDNETVLTNNQKAERGPGGTTEKNLNSSSRSKYQNGQTLFHPQICSLSLLCNQHCA
jgi:hypothetical protein